MILGAGGAWMQLVRKQVAMVTASSVRGAVARVTVRGCKMKKKDGWKV